MNKFVNYFLALFAFTTLVFLASCEETPETPAGAIVISLSPADDVLAAPGDTVEITVTMTNVATGTEATLVSNPGGTFADNDNKAASGESVSFVVPNDAQLGSLYTITVSVTSGSAQQSEQLDITVGYATVAEAIMKNPNLSILKDALVEANMVSALEGTGPFTVFAPSNTAFNAIDIDSSDDFPATEVLMTILNTHVTSGKLLEADLGDGSRLENLEGSDVRISNASGVVKVNDATVTVADQVAENGVVHIIDEVLLPSNSVGTATAVLLGGPLNTTVGSFYNVVEDDVYTSTQAQANGGKVDFLYWYVDDGNPATADSEAVIASPDNEFAPAAFPNTDFSSMTNATRFKATVLTTAQFDAVISQKNLEDAYSGDVDATDSRLTNLEVGDVFAYKLDDDRGASLGLAKVVAITGDFGSERKIELEVKHVK